MLLSLWDSDNRTAAAIDLWTKEMTVEDMNLFYYQVFHRLADSYLRATKNTDVAKLIHAFGDDFGHALGLLDQDDPKQNELLDI
jgi:gliding motility-associated protein GldC